MDDPLGRMIGNLCEDNYDSEQLLVILMFSFQMVKEYLNKDRSACDEKDSQQMDDPEHCADEVRSVPRGIS
jgi:hypothetical protein